MLKIQRVAMPVSHQTRDTIAKTQIKTTTVRVHLSTTQSPTY